MSDNSPNVIYLGPVDCDIRNIDNRCVKVELDEHVTAHLQNHTLDRNIKPLDCSNKLIDKVVLNYVIVKEILSNLSWQDKQICEQVCTTWNSAIQTLKREHLGPKDLVVDFQIIVGTEYKQSGIFNNVPLVVMVFVSTSAFCMTCPCKSIKPCPCSEPCDKDHCLIDVVNKYSCAPKECMTIVRSDYVSYMPLEQSETFKHTIIHLKTYPCLGGIYIPMIPNVEFRTINLKSNNNMQNDFYNIIDEMAKDRIFKGILVYVTDKYLLQSVEDIIFLNYLKDVQPNLPYALGGCIIEDTIIEQKDMTGIIEGVNKSTDFISDNLISMSLFTVPKNGSNEQNFEMYSLILDPSEWTKAKIKLSINEFAAKIPQYEHSVAIKLSCIGRDMKHRYEQECFRAAFPNTRIIGCFGNGEIGMNHPPKSPTPISLSAKRRKPEFTGPQFDVVYSYSTVFVLLCWGKMKPPRASK